MTRRGIEQVKKKEKYERAILKIGYALLG